MFKNLVRILNKKQVSNKSLATMLDMSEKTLWSKINEKTEFSLREAIQINCCSSN